jgi:hypothetical protein
MGDMGDKKAAARTAAQMADRCITGAPFCYTRLRLSVAASRPPLRRDML